MKKLLALILCTAMLSGLLVAPVAALIDGGTMDLGGSAVIDVVPADPSKPRTSVDTEQMYAVLLRELGLFRGVSATNFDLERAPTRLETLVMLIRVLGKEAEALAAKNTHPFDDVPAWANDYVGYAYATGLTKGSSATKFGTGDASCANYLTFVLRALGYSDANGDFAWDNPFDLAKSTGILTADVYTENFWRADVVTVSFRALSAKLKGEERTLADKLIGAGVFTKEAYEKYTDRKTVTVTICYDEESIGKDIRTYASILQATDPKHVYRVTDDKTYTIDMHEWERQATLLTLSGEALIAAIDEAFGAELPAYKGMVKELEYSADYKTARMVVDSALYQSEPMMGIVLAMTVQVIAENAQAFALVPVAERGSIAVTILSESGEVLYSAQ